MNKCPFRRYYGLMRTNGICDRVCCKNSFALPTDHLFRAGATRTHAQVGTINWDISISSEFGTTI